MMGNGVESDAYSQNSSRGLQPRILDTIFEEICKKRDGEPELEFMVKASYFEIYNEQIVDLVRLASRALSNGAVEPERGEPLGQRGSKKGGVFGGNH